MADVELYLAIGLPTFAFLVNVAVSLMHMSAIQARITSVESRVAGLETTMNSRFRALETRFETPIRAGFS